MEFWKKTCLLLCLYGFFKEMRPSESYLTEYLLGPVQDLTEDEVYYEIYPVWTYTYTALLVLAFLLTDLLRYKPIILVESTFYIVTWCLLVWARGVPWMKTVEFCYGITTAAGMAYFTYIYVQVPPSQYQRVASYTRTAYLVGRFFSGLLGQVLYSTDLMDAYTLNYLSLGSVTIALGFAVCLPRVSRSIYFHRMTKNRSKQDLDELVPSQTNDETKTDDPSANLDSNPSILENPRNTIPTISENIAKITGQIQKTLEKVYSDPEIEGQKADREKDFLSSNDNEESFQYNNKTTESLPNAEHPTSEDNRRRSQTDSTRELEGMFSLTNIKRIKSMIWADFLAAYSNRNVVQWSIWWAAATCGYLQAMNYIQPLWQSVVEDGDASIYNGAMDCISTFLGALSAFSVSYLSVDWNNTGELVLACVSLIQAVVLTVMGFTNSIVVSYIGYVIFRVLYEFIITIAGYQVAKSLKSDSYGLVFGINMFMSLVIQTVVTIIVIDVMQVQVAIQFFIYGCYFCVLAGIFFSLAAYRLGRGGCRRPTSQQ